MKFTAILAFLVAATFSMVHARQKLIDSHEPSGVLTCPTGVVAISNVGRPCGLDTAAAIMSEVPVADYNNSSKQASILERYDFWFCEQCRIDGKLLKPEQIRDHRPTGTTKNVCPELSDAIINHRYHALKKIITSDAFDINARLDDGGTTPLILAVNHALYKGSVRTDIIRLLLACPGIDINAKTTRTRQTQTALMRAAIMGFPIIVKILLMAGADRAVRDSDNATALAIARLAGVTRRGCCDLLATLPARLQYTFDERLDFATEDFYNTMCCGC